MGVFHNGGLLCPCHAPIFFQVLKCVFTECGVAELDGTIFAFNYFYTSVQFNPTEVANNLRTSGATIPGIRPGESTVTYLKKSVKKLTIAGSIALAVIAITPLIVGRYTGLSVPFAGSSLLIVTGVALECIDKINSYLTTRTSGSFLKRNKRRAR